MKSIKHDSSHQKLIDQKGKHLLSRISSKDKKVIIQSALDFSVRMHEGTKKKIWPTLCKSLHRCC